MSDKEGSRIFKEKVRDGSKIKKRYDKAKNPYERLLECNEISKRKEDGCAGSEDSYFLSESKMCILLLLLIVSTLNHCKVVGS